MLYNTYLLGGVHKTRKHVHTHTHTDTRATHNRRERLNGYVFLVIAACDDAEFVRSVILCTIHTYTHTIIIIIHRLTLRAHIAGE